MRVISLSLLGLAALLLAGFPCQSGAAAAREWVDDPAVAPDCSGRSDAELGCEISECGGYGTASGWAGEIQVCYVIPTPPLGGPWVVEYVAFFMSGTGTHQVIIRSADTRGGCPGEIIEDVKEFTPAYATWPPGGWTFVELRPEIPYPDHMQGGAGDFLMVGTELLPGDTIGLDVSAAGGYAWGFYEESWHDDSGVGLAVRVGLSDLGLSQSQRSTWGRVKGLFK